MNTKKTLKKSNNVTIKEIMEKIKARNLNDEIEKEDIKIKETHRKLHKIKIDSLKEFVYSNQKIPDSWKNKLHYQTDVLNIFAKDKNFLLYVGKVGPEGNEHNKIRPKTGKNKIIFRNKDRPLSYISKTGNDNININNYKGNELVNIKNYSSTNIQRKYNKKKDNKSLNEKELYNILEQLQNDFPIKEKLIELFPEQILNSINTKNFTIDNNTIKPSQRINIFRQNIYVNLVPQKSKSRNFCYNIKRIQSTYINNEKKKNYNDEFVKQKFKIKNANAKKYLESINFYGPYYSYCPPCANRNVEYYNNLDNKKLIKIVQQIRKMKAKRNFGNLSVRTKKIRNLTDYY